MKAQQRTVKQYPGASQVSLNVMNSAMFYARTAHKGWIEMSSIGSSSPLKLVATSPLEYALLTYEEGRLTETIFPDTQSYKDMLAGLYLDLRSDPSIHPEDLRVFSREVARVMDYHSVKNADKICGYTKKKTSYTNKAA